MGSGFKDWTAGDVLTAADVDGYLMRQTVMTFADASARDTALSGVLDEGMMAYLEDTNVTTYYDGSSWEDIRGLGGGSTTSPGGFSSGDVLDAADMNALPGGLLALDENSTTAVSLSSANTTLATISFTLATSRKVLLLATAPFVYNASTAGRLIDFSIRVTGGSIYQMSSISLESTTERKSVVTQRLVTLSAATHTISFEAVLTSGTATAFAGGGRTISLAAFDMGN